MQRRSHFSTVLTLALASRTYGIYRVGGPSLHPHISASLSSSLSSLLESLQQSNVTLKKIYGYLFPPLVYYIVVFLLIARLRNPLVSQSAILRWLVDHIRQARDADEPTA